MNPDDDTDPIEQTFEFAEEINAPTMNVHVDLVELFDRFSGDQAKTLGFLGDLKDLLR